MKWLCKLPILALTSSSTCLYSQVVYVTNADSNSISAYTINASSGALTVVPGSPFPGGASPREPAIDSTGKFLYVPNTQININNRNPIVTLSIAAYAINAGSGALTPVQGSPFLTDANTGITVDPSGKFLYSYVCCNSSGILAYTINAASGALTKIPGSTGDHFPTDGQVQGLAVDPAGRFLYIETNNSLSVDRIDAGSGGLIAVPGSLVKANFGFAGGASVSVHPSGKFVYTCSLDGAVAYSVAAGSGALTAIQVPSEACRLLMDPKGRFAFSGLSGGVYSVNPDNGALTKVPGSPGKGFFASAMDPSGSFLYIPNYGSITSGSVSAYAINDTTGALTEIRGSPFFNIGMGFNGIAIHNLATPPAPLAVTSLAPSSATAGGAGFTLTITGTGFVSGSTAQWNGAPLAMTFSSATQLTALVPASLIATAGSASITVSNPGGMASKAVSFTINPPGISISANGVVNGASHARGAVSAGEIVTISGSNFGSGALVSYDLDSNGYVTTSLGGVQALFDGVAAPLLSAQAGQVTAVVPYEVSGNPSTQLQISYQGRTSSAVAVPVAAAAPGIFTADSSGSGQGLIANEDGSMNAPGNPAAVGSTVVVYATGEGQTIPGGVDGKLGDEATPPVPIQTVTATVGGLDAPVVAAGGVSGQVAGYLQVSLQIPPDVAVGDSVPIVLNIGGISSQATVTLAIQ